MKAISGVDDVVKYDKVHDNLRIDLFDATVFSCMQMLKHLAKSDVASRWLKGGE